MISPTRTSTIALFGRRGRFHCLITTPRVTPTHRYHLIVGRPFSRADFTAVDTRVLQTLLPYIGRLIAIETDVARARDKTVGLLAVFDRISQNVLMLSSDGEVQFANAGARMILQLRDGLLLVNNKLATGNPALNAELQRHIAQVTAVDGVAEATVQLTRPSGYPAFQVTILRMDDARASGINASAGAMLIVHQPDAEAPIDGWSLGRTYGLTGRELEIAMLLARSEPAGRRAHARHAIQHRPVPPTPYVRENRHASSR